MDQVFSGNKGTEDNLNKFFFATKWIWNLIHIRK